MRMKETILKALYRVEFEHNVQILYACESGSRCWSFASEDSDYDVRFIYVRHVDDYLKGLLTKERDNLEISGGHPLAHPLDISGWDLPKALKLFRKSNPPIYEWLRSPIVYRSNNKFVDRLQELIKDYYNYSAMCYHYLHMASGNNRQYLQGSEVRTKKYLYVLRPLLSVLWVMEHDMPPPLDFRALVGLTLGNRTLGNKMELLEAIESLVIYKEQGSELMTGPRIEPISEFIDDEVDRLHSMTWPSTKKERPWEPLQDLFVDTLADNYGEI